MLIAWFIFAFFLIFALFDIKKAIILWIPLHVLTNPQIALRYTPPLISVSIAVSTMLCALFLIKCWSRDNYYNLNRSVFILKPVFIITLLSYLFSYFFSVTSFSVGLNFTIRYFVESFILLYAFQKCLSTESDLNLCIKTIFIVVVLITTLGIYEFFTLHNPVLDYVYYNSPHNDYTVGRLAYNPLEHRMRYGLPRCYSFFPLHLRFGAACVFFVFLFGVMLKHPSRYLKKNYIIMCICLLIIGVFASNSKQAYVSVIVLLFCFVRPQVVFNYKTLLLALLVFVIISQYPELLNNYFSLFDEELAEQGRGSTIAVREEQYQVAIDLFNMSPIFGHGPNSLSYLKRFGDNDAIRGAESIFLSLLPERGLFGAFAYIFMYIYLFFSLKKSIPYVVLFFYLLTIFVMEVAGGRKDMTLYMGMLIVVLRYYQLNKKQISK